MREYRRGIKNGQSRETGNIGYTRRRKTKEKHNTICVGHNYYTYMYVNKIKSIAFLGYISFYFKNVFRNIYVFFLWPYKSVKSSSHEKYFHPLGVIVPALFFIFCWVFFCLAFAILPDRGSEVCSLVSLLISVTLNADNSWELMNGEYVKNASRSDIFPCVSE